MRQQHVAVGVGRVPAWGATGKRCCTTPSRVGGGSKLIGGNNPSRQDFVNDPGFEVEGDLFPEPATLEEELFVVQAQQVQDGGVQVLDADRVFHGPIAELVG